MTCSWKYAFLLGLAATTFVVGTIVEQQKAKADCSRWEKDKEPSILSLERLWWWAIVVAAVLLFGGSYYLRTKDTD